VNKFFIIVKVQGIKFFFDKIFNGFYIVIGDFFNVFDFLGIFDGKIPVNFPELFK